MKSVDAIFDESVDGQTPIMPGTYPAHVVGFTTREFDSGSTVFNLSYKIAEEAKDMNIAKQHKNGQGNYEPTLGQDGKPVEVSAGYMVGKTFYANGVWLTPSPEKGQGWKNRKYVETMQSMGVKFDVNDDGQVTLAEVEEDDVMGLPALVSLSEEEYTNRNGEAKTSFKVVNVDKWEDGQRLSVDEIDDEAPF